jgi:hypothetical protein
LQRAAQEVDYVRRLGLRDTRIRAEHFNLTAGVHESGKREELARLILQNRLGCLDQSANQHCEFVIAFQSGLLGIG